MFVLEACTKSGFVYLRKGEAESWEVAAGVFAYAASAWSLFVQIMGHGRAANWVFTKVQGLVKTLKRPRPPKFRILYWHDQRHKKLLAFAASVGPGVDFKTLSYANKHYAGMHRYFLNQKRYCVFLRIEKWFVGTMGTTATTRSELKKKFEAEWRAHKRLRNQ